MTARRSPQTRTMAAPHHSASFYLSRISLGVPFQDVQQELIAAFSAADYPECISNLTGWGIDPKAYIDGLDQIIDTLELESDIYKRCLRALRKTCGIYGILPSSHLMPPGLTLVVGTVKRPFASNGFSDVWKASNDDGRIFAVKQLRTYDVDDLRNEKKRYCKAVVICKRARHKNVLSVEGVAPGLFEFTMVSEWMDNGNMLQYVRTRGSQVNRMGLLLGIARGLNYLHSNEVIHGDLKGPNILIDWQGNPLLADFGLSSITRNVTSVNASTPHSGGTVRWSAPELLDAFWANMTKKLAPTTTSDVYALSMVIIELYTGNVPYANRLDPAVILMVARGERPPKPVPAEALGLTPAVWELTKRCWHNKPKKRPAASEVLAHLENLAHPGSRSSYMCSYVSIHSWHGDQ